MSSQTRVAVLLEDQCQPKKCQHECWAFCPPVRNGIECIVIDPSNQHPIISEPLCIGCGICVNKCPFDALVITQLPSTLDSECIHRFGRNGFRLYRLPSIESEGVIGMLGPNGMGKSTALSVLAGTRQPNLGDWEIDSAAWDDIIQSVPSGLVREHMVRVSAGESSVSMKPQAIDRIPKVATGRVESLLRRVDDRDLFDKIIPDLGLEVVLEREIAELSGGELQRVAIAATMLKEADLYFFDEPTSYLDIYERLRVSRVIRELSTEHPVLVVEHDLAILDLLCDKVHIIYGRKGAFGIMTQARPTRTAINTYLNGFLKEENMRIRDRPIVFQKGVDRIEGGGQRLLDWGDVSKQLGTFTLTAEGGRLNRAEVVGVVGPNGTGKTTFARILAGHLEADAGWISSDARISFKPQQVEPEHEGTVEMWLMAEAGMNWRRGDFTTNVIRPLGIESLLERSILGLSGGELQSVSIAVCLARDADLYVLDEPSAHLDANARMEASRAIRRTMEAMERAALVIDHDVYFIDLISDRLLVFEGQGGLAGAAVGPMRLRQGMNQFLAAADVTFRRDHDSHRPRVNKLGSRLDREQRAAGEYFYAD